MARILLNPDTGAPIKDYTTQGVTPFTKDNPFETGTLFQFEDEKVAEAFLEQFGFLEELNADDAKKFLAMEKLKCEQCDFTTRSKAELERHIVMHSKEKELSDLGIPVLKKQHTIGSLDDKVTDLQKSIDAQDRAEGLEGAGLINDTPQKNIIMS
jgi:hypothetical protein